MSERKWFTGPIVMRNSARCIGVLVWGLQKPLSDSNRLWNVGLLIGPTRSLSEYGNISPQRKKKKKKRPTGPGCPEIYSLWLKIGLILARVLTYGCVVFTVDVNFILDKSTQCLLVSLTFSQKTTCCCMIAVAGRDTVARLNGSSTHRTSSACSYVHPSEMDKKKTIKNKYNK